MPVTFHPAKHPSNPVFISQQSKGANTSPLDFLEYACPAQYRKCAELLQSSWETDISSENPIIPQHHGFVDTVRDAYSNHHALSVRPDDVWISILTQFNSFVNANAEMLRSHFVGHEGQEKLVVAVPTGNRYTADFGYLSTLMAGEIRKNVKDPELADWVIPKFSTTTLNDVIVSSVLMMSTMQKYFCYEFLIGCGLPSVTLEGERSDYEELLKRIERLKDFAKDIETKNPGSEKVKQLRRWYDYLRPVLSRFAKAFDDPHGEENLDFWQRVADKEGGGSSVPYFSGWINAFCVFDTEGRWIGGKLDESDPGNTQVRHRQRTLILDSITYPVNSVIPYGYASVPVKVDDGEELECEMVSGLVGMKLTSQDSVQPFAGWCIFVKKPEDEVELDEYGRRY